MPKNNNQVTRLLRRSIALFLAASTVWLLCTLAQPGLSGEVLTDLGESPAFVKAALQAELGRLSSSESPLSSLRWWQTAVLTEAPLLREGEESVAAFLSGERKSSPSTDLLPPTQSILIGEDTPPAFTPLEEDEDESEAISGAQSEVNIVARTLTAGASSAWLHAGDVSLYNRANLSFDFEALAAELFSLELGDAPAVLIYHTHGSESYARDAVAAYVETDPARTDNELYNVVRVGDELAATLKSYGISVIHDRALYDYPVYNNSYARSLEGITAYLEKYPSIRVVLDLHRDALEASDGTIYKTVAEIDGETAAQVLLVVGSAAGGQAHPNWRENLKFAVALQRQLNEDFPTLARPITLRASRYNQQISSGALLIEMGTHGNTLQEALYSAQLLGQSLANLLT